MEDLISGLRRQLEDDIEFDKSDTINRKVEEVNKYFATIGKETINKVVLYALEIAQNSSQNKFDLNYITADDVKRNKKPNKYEITRIRRNTIGYNQTKFESTSRINR